MITQWIGDASSATLRVDLGAPRTLARVTIVRNPVTTFPAPPNGDKGVTDSTVSADARVEVSADGHTWRTLGTVVGTRLRGSVAGDGSPPAT